MHIEASQGDVAVLAELGHRLAQVRIDRGTKQVDLAKQAGIGTRTLERLESGDSVQLLTLVRVLRQLALLDNINVLAPEAGPRPMDYVKRKGRLRCRAPRGPTVLREPVATWKWGDEK